MEWDTPKKKRTRRTKSEVEGQVYQEPKTESFTYDVPPPEDEPPTPKTVQTAYTGPVKRPGDVWCVNNSRRAYMRRGHSIRPGTGIWLSAKDAATMEKVFNAG